MRVAVAVPVLCLSALVLFACIEEARPGQRLFQQHQSLRPDISEADTHGDPADTRDHAIDAADTQTDTDLPDTNLPDADTADTGTADTQTVETDTEDTRNGDSCTVGSCAPSTEPCITNVCVDGACTPQATARDTPCVADGTPSDTCEGETYHAPDTCDGAGACIDGGSGSCASDNSCESSACVAGQGCVVTPLPSDTPCGEAPDGACEGNRWRAAGRCDGGGACEEGDVVSCEEDGACTVGACDPHLGCVIKLRDEGTLCEADGVSGVCDGNNWYPEDTCDAEGRCVDTPPVTCGPPQDSCGGATCEEGQGCVPRNTDDADACLTGCSDGTREGFADVTVYRDIASCGGAWTVPGVYADAPSCERGAGNDGDNVAGEGCNVQDLCAEGWSICDDLDTIAAATGEAGCDDAVAEDYPNFGTGPLGHDAGGVPLTGTPGGAFFLAAVTGGGLGRCEADPAILDDIFGCGNMGRPANAGCAPLNRFGSNACDGLHDYRWPMGQDRDNPATDFGYVDASTWSWWCPNTHNVGEPTTVIKYDADRQGGVLCCRNP